MVAQNRGEKSKGIKELHGIIICLCLMCQSAYKDLTEKRAQEEKKKKNRHIGGFKKIRNPFYSVLFTHP